MTSQEYIDYCRIQLARSFQVTSEGKKDPKQKYRTEGLLQAARLLGLLNKDEIESIMEAEHFKVFGESISQRSNRKLGLEELKQQNPDEYYEIPAIRRITKTKK